MKSTEPSPLVGTPTDQVPGMLATGRTTITTIYTSMSTRHLQGRDASYLEWHTLDHRPEQYRLPGLRAAFRVVSTPACRAARAASDPRYDATDHLMTYMFVDRDSLQGFSDLAVAMGEAGRIPYLLPSVERAVYQLAGTVAAPRIKAGADVLPWWPNKGIYVLIERGEASANELLEVTGVGGAWWGSGSGLPPPLTTASNEGLQITYCFLDADPAKTAERLRPILQDRWKRHGLQPLLAAPFHTVIPYEWERFLP